MTTATIRLRISAHDAHYAGNLVDGARMLQLFGDVATELLIRLDGDEGLFVAYDAVEFLAPVLAGDYIEATGEITRTGKTSRTMKFEARKVITNAGNNSAALFRNRGIGCSTNAAAEPWKAPLVGECRSVTGTQTVRQQIYTSTSLGIPGFRVRCQFVDKSGVNPPTWCGSPSDGGIWGIGICLPANIRAVEVTVWYQNLQKGAGSFGGTIWGKYRSQKITVSPRTLALN